MLLKGGVFIAVKLTQLIYVKIIAHYRVLEELVVVMIFTFVHIYHLGVNIKFILAHKMINFNDIKDKENCFFR